MAGAGVKLPLGKTNLKYEQGVPNLDLQPGTGSWDLIGYLSYGLKIKSIGLNSVLTIKHNGKDHDNYRYGTTFNSTVNLFNDFKIKRVTIRVQSGLYIEHALMDASFDAYNHNRTDYSETGGSVLFGNAGLQFYFQDFMIFGEYQKMLKSALNGYSQLLTLYKFNLGLTYNF